VRRWLPQLYRARRAHRIDNLIKVEPCNREAENRAHGLAAAAGPEDEQGEDHQMGQAFGILSGIDRAYAEGKKAGQNSGQGRIWTRSRYGHWAGGSKARRWRRYDGLVLPLAVVAFLVLVRLSTGVVIFLFFFLLLGIRLCRCGRSLELPHSRLDFIHEANIFVILDCPAGGLVIGALDSGGPQIQL